MNTHALLIFIIMMQTPYLLFEFNKNTDPGSWKIVNDGVMGGKSKGKLSVGNEGHGIFEGFVSLENNGGFTMVRYPFSPMDVSKFSSLEIRLKGDGKTYQIRLKSSPSQYYNYSCTIKTSGEWQTILLPFTEFLPRFRGMSLDKPAYAGEELGEVAILIGNKKAEEFRMEIDRISLR